MKLALIEEEIDKSETNRCISVTIISIIGFVLFTLIGLSLIPLFYQGFNKIKIKTEGHSYTDIIYLVNNETNNYTLPAFYMFDTQRPFPMFHFVFVVIAAFLFAGIFETYEENNTSKLYFDEFGINTFRVIVGLSWEIAWEIFEILSSQLMYLLYPSAITLHYIYSVYDTSIDIMMGLLGSIYGSIYFYKIFTKMFGFNSIGRLWRKRSLINKLIYLVVLIGGGSISPLFYYIFVEIFGYDVPIGYVVWCCISMFLLWVMLLLDLFASNGNKDKKFPLKYEILANYTFVTFYLLFCEVWWLMFFVFNYNSYLSTLYGTIFFGIFVFFVGSLLLTIRKGFYGFLHGFKKLFLQITYNVSKYVCNSHNWEWRGTSVDIIVSVTLCLISVGFIILFLCILIFVKGDIYLSNVSSRLMYDDSIIFREYFSISHWPYVHLLFPFLTTVLIGSLALQYNFKPLIISINNIGRKIRLPITKKYKINIMIIFFIFSIGVASDVLWEITESIITQIGVLISYTYNLEDFFMVNFDENVGDVGGDLIQAIVGALIGVLFLIVFNRKYKSRSLLWQFKPLLNKLLYFGCIIVFACGSFIGVYSKKFPIGISLNVGNFVWIWIVFICLIVMFILDLITKIPKYGNFEYLEYFNDTSQLIEELKQTGIFLNENKQFNIKEKLPSRKDIRIFWIIIIGICAIMHFTFVILNFFNLFTYLITYIGVVLSFIYVVFWVN